MTLIAYHLMRCIERVKIMKFLILEYLDTKNEIILFKIKDQSHRGVSFGSKNSDGRKSRYFLSTTNIRLQSDSWPDFVCNLMYADVMPVLYTRGKRTSMDNMIISASSQYWAKIKQSVREYNNYFGYYGPSIIGEVFEQIIPNELFTLD